jgi:hypothetical protein
MNRTQIAFLVAPLWVPLVMLLLAKFDLFPYDHQGVWIAITIVLAAFFGYAGTFIFGVPAFMFFRSRGFTSCWLAGILGFCIGAIVMSAFVFFFALALQSSVEEAANTALSIFDPWKSNQLFSALLAGSIGSLVGITLWFIARPDRN